MDPRVYERLWDKIYEAYDPNVLRTRRRNHPIIEKWISENEKRADRALNPLHFMHKSRFRTSTQKRRLRMFNTLMWVLKSEGFTLEADEDNIIVGQSWHYTKFKIIEGTDRPARATSPTWRIPNGHLSCRIEARLPPGIEKDWEDEPGAPLETRIPDVIASFAVWALERKRNGPK
jgi:hypothetical protein